MFDEEPKLKKMANARGVVIGRIGPMSCPKVVAPDLTFLIGSPQGGPWVSPISQTHQTTPARPAGTRSSGPGSVVQSWVKITPGLVPNLNSDMKA